MSVKLKDFMKDVDIPFTYREWPGSHEFYLWNKSLHLACEHFFHSGGPGKLLQYHLISPTASVGFVLT